MRADIVDLGMFASDRFDAAVSFETIEHISDPHHGIGGMKRSHRGHRMWFQSTCRCLLFPDGLLPPGAIVQTPRASLEFAMRDARSVLVIFAVAVSLGTFSARSGIAGTQDEALLVLHAKSRTVKSSTVCTTWSPTIPCREYTTSWPVGVGCDIYLVVVRGDEGPGISGLSCGLQYDPQPSSGVDMFGYTLCADSESPSAGPNGMWPEPGGGNRISWNPDTNCQRTVISPDGVHAVACSFYVHAYSPDLFVIDYDRTRSPVPEMTITDCAGAITPYGNACLKGPGFIGFGQPGCTPCEGGPCWICTETQPETWGTLKQMFGR